MRKNFFQDLKMKIKFTPTFEKYFKKYLKKDKKLLKELEKLIEELKQNPKIGQSLGNNLYKIRIKGFNKGKSGGYRVINYIKNDNEIILVIIYAKNEYSDIAIKKLEEILKEI